MEIKWLGDTTFIVSSNISTILIEPSDAILKSRLKEHNLICLNYNEHNRVKQQIDYNLFSGPGEYESGGISIKGVATNGTTDASEKMINTIFNVEIDGIQTAFFGRPSSKFNDSTIRELGKVDVLIIQSNNQFLDMDQIAYAIREIEPKIVIFSNFGSKETISPDLQNLISELGSQNTTIVNKITLSKSNITENRQIIVLDENSS